MEAVNNSINDFRYIVYCTTNKVNNKIYIGVHKTYSKTFDGYIGCGVYVNKSYSYQRCNTPFQRAVTKYGPNNFVRKTIAEFDNEDDAMQLEQDIVDSEFLARDDVYNIALGGYGNKNMLPSHKCYCYTSDGKFYKGFDSIRDAGRAMTNKGIVFTSIKNAIIDKVLYRNFYWSFQKHDRLNLTQYRANRRPSVKVYQYNSNGKFEKEYNSQKEAAVANNLCTSSLNKACMLGYLSKGKYFSFKKMEQFSDAKLKQLKNSPIYVYSFSGKFIAEYQNELEAKKALHIKGSLMKYLRLKEPYKNMYQFSFEHLDKMCNRTIGQKLTTKKPIDQYDLQGNFIKTWPSITECCKTLNIQSSCIYRILKGTQTKTREFTFKYHKN